MKITEKKEFVEQLIDAYKKDILSRVEAMPETWDGHELRQYIADRFSECPMPLKGARKRDYENILRPSLKPGREGKKWTSKPEISRLKQSCQKVLAVKMYQ